MDKGNETAALRHFEVTSRRFTPGCLKQPTAYFFFAAAFLAGAAFFTAFLAGAFFFAVAIFYSLLSLVYAPHSIAESPTLPQTMFIQWTIAVCLIISALDSRCFRCASDRAGKPGEPETQRMGKGNAAVAFETQRDFDARLMHGALTSSMAEE